MLFSIPNLAPAIPEMFMLFMAVIVLLGDLFHSRHYRHIAYVLTQVTLLSSLVLTLNLYHFKPLVTFHGSFILDHAGTILKVFIEAVTFCVLLYSRDYVREQQLPEGEYYLLTLLIVLGMCVLVSAYSFITLYLGLELMSLPLYALIALRRESGFCAEAAMKYFIMGAVASAMLLYGLSMIYGATGNLNLVIVAFDIAHAPLSQSLIFFFGLVFVIAAIAFKLGAVPFHMWVPDVYEGAPLSVTLFIATAVKVAAFALAARLLINAMPVLQLQWQQILMAIAILSMGLGNIVAIVQTNIKRLLAYSSIAHMGYMLLGFVAGTSQGYGAAMFYTIVYVIMSLGAFGILIVLSRRGLEIENIDDLKGLNARNPWLAFLMLLIMFSMAGIPPSAGFFAKVGVLESLISVHLVWLAVLALLFAIVGAYYYLKVVKVMYFDAPVRTEEIKLPGFAKSLTLSVNGLLVLILGVFPTGLFSLCQTVF